MSSSSSGCGNPYDPDRYILPREDTTPQTDLYYACGDSSSSSSSCLGADYCISCINSAEYGPDDPRGKEPPQPVGCFYPVVNCDTREVLYNIWCSEDGIDTADLYNLFYKVGDDCLEVDDTVTLFPNTAQPIDLGLVDVGDVYSECGCVESSSSSSSSSSSAASTPDVCADCNMNSGVPINDPTVSGIIGDCSGLNMTFTGLGMAGGSTFGDLNTCEAVWTDNDGSYFYNVELYYANSNTTLAAGSGCELSLLAGEWAVLVYSSEMANANNFAYWLEKTTGFSCDHATGVISGTHTFSGGTCEFGSDSSPDDWTCSGVPTVTIPA